MSDLAVTGVESNFNDSLADAFCLAGVRGKVVACDAEEGPAIGTVDGDPLTADELSRVVAERVLRRVSLMTGIFSVGGPLLEDGLASRAERLGAEAPRDEPAVVDEPPVVGWA